MLQKSPIIFAGPSLTPQAKALIKKNNLTLRNPVQRTDIAQLLEAEFKGTIIIVDGLFHQVLAVGHAEIRSIIRAGCVVYGLSSMGAIRAYEMEILGMRGYGQVFNWFKQEEDFQDDEVALIHGPAPEYFMVTEPMVHFRVCVQHLVANNLLDAAKGAAIIQKLKSKYYGDRTLKWFLQMLEEVSAIDSQALKQNFDKYRIKQLDLIHFLENKVWDT